MSEVIISCPSTANLLFTLILFFKISSSAFRLEVFKWSAKYLFILNYSSSFGEEKYSPIVGSSSKLSNPVFAKNSSEVPYKIGLPGTSSSPDLITRPLDSNVLIDDSDSTPLISETFNLVTGCSYAIIARVSNAGVDNPFNIDGGLTESKYFGISLTVTRSDFTESNLK